MNATSLPVTLLIGGDIGMHAVLRFLLESDGYAVFEAADAGTAPPLLQGAEPALVVVVAGEREGAALAALSEIRRVWPRAATTLLARDAGLTVRRGAFALGVQDIVPLPVGPHDLQARLRAALGPRAEAHIIPHTSGDAVRAGGLLLNTATREVTDGAGWTVRLTHREAMVLAALMAQPGRVVGRQALVERVWGDDQGGANALAVYVRRLRAKIERVGAAHGYVHTAHGQGYVFDARSTLRPDDQRLEGAREGTEARQEILVVDDDRATLDMMAEVLRMAGYTVTCGVGPQAPTLARQTLPTVILLDINMPGMNGIEVRQRLRESPRTATIPVIALSAGGNLRLRAKEMGADDYLAKPFSTDELLLRVEKWAGRAR